MKRKEIIRIQERVGTIPDGFWGPKSIAACQAHLRRLMPDDNPFPHQGTRAFDQFYGPHGVPRGYTPPGKNFRLPFAIYYGNTPVRSLTAHARCADSLQRAFERLAEVYPDEKSRRAAGILTYAGLYNPRRMRGARAWSLHAWRCAIDLDPARNRNRSAWPVRSSMPIEVMECFAREGWLSAGAFWGRDAMHFQATAP